MVTYIQPHLIPHLILRGVIGLVALARRTLPRRCQPQLLVPTRRFHEVSGASELPLLLPDANLRAAIGGEQAQLCPLNKARRRDRSHKE